MGQRLLKKAVVASMIIRVLLIGQATAAASTLKPNYSIFFYKPGTAVTGTLKDGVFTQKQTPILLGKWTYAAVSGDSLLLYNARKARLKTGTFVKGIFTPVRTKRFSAGWTHVAASCDTVLFYDRATGDAFAAPFTHGVLGTHTAYQLSPGWDFIDASCDTITFLANNGTSNASGVNGTLKGGKFTESGGSFVVAPYTHLTHTSDSYLLYSKDRGAGIWGPSSGGTEGLSGSATDFSAWDLVVGTADSILFYRSDGLEARATLRDGAYGSVGSGDDFSAGWKIIAGGR